jgi:outer membrane protein assembly factor BamE
MTVTKRLVIAASTLGLCLLASGCVYRINISQGNFLESKTVDQVTIGMTRSQVRYLLGTPMVADSFHPDRWDYLYYFKTGKTQKVDRQLIILFFADDKLIRIEKPTGAFRDPTIPAATGA